MYYIQLHGITGRVDWDGSVLRIYRQIFSVSLIWILLPKQSVKNVYVVTNATTISNPHRQRQHVKNVQIRARPQHTHNACRSFLHVERRGRSHILFIQQHN